MAKQQNIGVPLHSIDLVKKLEADYPPRCRRLDESHEAHERYAGKVELITTLRVSIERAEEKVLNTKR